MIQYTIKEQYGYSHIATLITDLPEHIIERTYKDWQLSRTYKGFIEYLKSVHPTAIIIEADSLKQETIYFE